MTRHAEPLADPIASDYLDWCERERTPRNTIKRRRTVLRAVGTPGTISREDLEAWWDGRQHLKDSSRANELAVLRSFYTWCQVWERRTDNPTVRISTPKAGAGAPRPVTRREWDLIIAHVKDDGPMRRAMYLAVWAGLRREEAARLSWSDIDPDTRVARVLGKGRKTRLVKFSTRLIEELLPDHGGNVVTGTEQAWAPDTLGRKVNAAIRAAGVDATYHKLRHRYGSLAYQRTKDPKALAELMGHASVATTMSFYAAAADDAADAIADAVVDE